MRTVCALALAVCLVAPAAASAKGGVIFDRYPDVQKVGSAMKFTVMTFRNKEGVHPLVTFRNTKTGEVVRVRTGPTDLNGIAYGSVRLPSTGPWDTLITNGGLPMAPGDAAQFRVGVGLTQTIPSADATRSAPRPVPGAHGASGFPWVWVLSFASIGSGLLVLVMRRLGRWGAA